MFDFIRNNFFLLKISAYREKIEEYDFIGEKSAL